VGHRWFLALRGASSWFRLAGNGAGGNPVLSLRFALSGKRVVNGA